MDERNMKVEVLKRVIKDLYPNSDYVFMAFDRKTYEGIQVSNLKNRVEGMEFVTSCFASIKRAEEKGKLESIGESNIPTKN